MAEFEVPNAPCGVERKIRRFQLKYKRGVPNAPCGVESALSPAFAVPVLRFLMHRVELKAEKRGEVVIFFPSVPNAPCGVESTLAESIGLPSLLCS